MTALSPQLLDYLYKIAVDEQSAAFVKIDEGGAILEFGGRLEHYGLDHISKGQAATEFIVVLEGIIPIDSETFILPRVELTPGIFADIHLVKTEQYQWILLLDVSEDVQQHQILQQHGYELGFLRDRLAEQNQKLAEANLVISTANVKMKKDLDAAAKVQQALLPYCLPSTEDMDFAWIFTPCDELAGDILNIFQLDDHHICFYLLDVSGHGVPAALMSVSLSRMLSPSHDQSSLITKPDPDTLRFIPETPGEVGKRLNRQFVMDHRTEQYFTLVYGLINTQTNELHFICAGHPSPIYFPRDGIPHLVKSTDLPIGFLEDADFTEIKLQLKPGDRFYLYSDGIVEATNTQKQLFGEERLLQSLQHTASVPIALSLKTLENEVLAWSNHIRQDDISILAVEFVGGRG